MSIAANIALILAGAGISYLVAAYWYDRTHPAQTAAVEQQAAESTVNDDIAALRQVNTELRELGAQLAAELAAREGK